MTPGSPAILSEAERFDWLRLLRCDNIGPRSFHALVGRYGSAGAALEALPALIASGRAGRPVRIAEVEEIDQELEALRGCGAVACGATNGACAARGFCGGGGTMGDCAVLAATAGAAVLAPWSAASAGAPAGTLASAVGAMSAPESSFTHCPLSM